MAELKNTPISKAMMDVTLQGFQKVKEALDALEEIQTTQARATYSGLTGSGKSRYVQAMVDAVGSQAKVADMLDLSPGRISQLVKSEKNRKNGK